MKVTALKMISIFIGSLTILNILLIASAFTQPRQIKLKPFFLWAFRVISQKQTIAVYFISAKEMVS